MSDQIKYDMRPSPLAAGDSYVPLRFRIGTPSRDQARRVAALIFRGYLGRPIPYERLRAGKEWTVTWSDDKGNSQTSRPFRFDWLVQQIQEEAALRPDRFNLPPLRAGWLDASVEVMKPFQAPATDGTPRALTMVFPPALSDAFPVQPKLDREGRAFSSLQLMLLSGWSDLRTKLVEHSHLLFHGYDWLRDLFMYLNTVVSSVDNTLHQIYYRAEYEAAAEGWRFDRAVLGPPTARRVVDKLKWVGQITGNPLDDCRSEIESFRKIKDVRNHLAHFDPPTFAFTIEDVADWLNATEAVARLLVAIRNRVNQPLCEPLIALLLARPVEWYPADPGKRRVSQGPDVGYGSSCWPTDPVA
jgi:hypothetical protein